MSDVAIATDEPRYQLEQHSAKTGRSIKLTRRVRQAVDAMVWQGLTRADAAQHAGLKDNSLYAAFLKPDVKAYYLAQCEVLRLSGRARRIHRLEQMTEQDENKMAVVQAVRALDNIPDDEVRNRSTAPFSGLVVVINSTPVTAHQQQIEAKPLIVQVERSTDDRVAARPSLGEAPR